MTDMMMTMNNFTTQIMGVEQLAVCMQINSFMSA